MTSALDAPVADTLDADVPLAVRRAVRAIEAYPDVRGLRLLGRTRERLELAFEAEVPLPLTDGPIGPFGVRRHEPITLHLPLRFPLEGPTWWLRESFDRSHPHLEPATPARPPEPCLVNRDAREVALTRGGMTALLDQLLLWLERAASRRLIDHAEGWEPVRRDTIDDRIFVDGGALRDKVSRGGGAQWYLTYAPRDTAPSGVPRTLVSVLLSTARRLESAVALLRPAGDPTAPGLALVLWAGRAGNADEPPVIDRYEPETVASVRDLLERADDYGVRAPLALRLGELEGHLRRGRERRAFELAIIVLVRRPAPLLDTGAPIELCPYVMTVDSPDALTLDAGAPVRPAAQIDTLSARLLREVAGRPPSTATPWSLVGCGSVGSKIALHAARSAAAPVLVLDSAPMSPHNFARHALVPEERDGVHPSSYYKSDRLATLLGTFGARPRALTEDVLALLASSEGRARLVPKGTSVLVDTTGSVTVRQALASSSWSPRRPRLLSVCLLGAGRAALLVAEGAAGNPDLEEIVGEFYWTLRERPALAALVHGAEASGLAIGQGCASRTFLMSDAQLSALTAPLALALEPLLDGAGGTDGLLRFGELDPGTLDQRWSTLTVAPYVEATPEPGSSARVRIAPRAVEAIDRDIAAHPGVETGGVLLGRHGDLGERFQVLDVRAAPPGSVRSAERFTLSPSGLIELQREIERDSNGTLRVIGTWHNHLADTAPSALDRASARALARAHVVPHVLLIRTPQRWRFVTSDEAASAPPTPQGPTPRSA